MDAALYRMLALAVAGLAALGCATVQAPTRETPSGEPSGEAVLSKRGERYLRLTFLFTCAPEYLPYPDGEGPPVPARTEAEREQRKEQLLACQREVAETYTTPDAVRALTKEPGGQGLSDAEIAGVVQRGDAFLDAYVQGLLERERQREGEPAETASSPDVLGSPSPAPGPEAPPDAPAPGR